MSRRTTLKINQKVTRNFGIEVKGVDKEAGTLEAIFSTQDEDRHGDTVVQDGWDLKSFKKNPVILNSHNYGSADEVIGKATNLRIEGKKLIGKITFAVAENPKAKVIFDLYAGGFLSAFSVGFIVKKFKEDDYFVIEEAELLEVSAVSVPANARALAKQKGIDVEALPEGEDETEEDEDEGEEDEDGEGDTPTDPEPAPEAPETTEETVEEETPEETPAAPVETTEEAPEAEEEEVETPAEPVVVAASYKQRAAKVIHKMNMRQKQNVTKAHAIIQSMLEGDTKGEHPDRKVAEQIRKRKAYKAIRILMESTR